MAAVAPVEDDGWARILASRPHLVDEVQAYAHVYRGEEWFLLVNTLSNQQFLLELGAYRLLQQLDGERTVGETLERLGHVGDDLPQDAVATLFTRLLEAGMLAGDMRPSVEALAERHSARTRQQQFRKLLTPFAIRIPLFDPTALLERLAGPTRFVFSGWGFAAVLALIVTAASLALENGARIEQHWATRFEDPTNLVWLPLLYILVKGFHELGHGLAARHWGAEVHELGLMFLVFFPVPYVDASASSTFYRARQRMTVAAAGIVTELTLASLATLGWLYLDEGVFTDLLFNVAVIGGISTLLFNGNPLLRLDGYYVLSDLLQIPNLGPRSSAMLGYLLKARLLGLEVIRPRAVGSEARWLISYGIASLIYRLALSFVIAVYVAGRFFIFGIFLALWFLVYQFARPALLAVLRILPEVHRQQRVTRFALVALGLVVVLPVLVFTVPLPQSTVAYGVIIPPDDSLLRVSTPGFVRGLQRANGDQVQAGEVIASLEDVELQWRAQRLKARYEELDAQFRGVLTVNRLEAEALKTERDTLSQELKEVRLQLGELQLASQVSGRYTSSGSDPIDRWVARGEVLGFVTQPGAWTLKVMIRQDAIDLVRSDSRLIRAISYSDPATAVAGTLISETPHAVFHLPSRSLGSLGGGNIPVDLRDPEGLKLIEPMFQVDVRLADADYIVGQSFLVRFLHNSESAGVRLLRWFRVFISRQLVG